MEENQRLKVICGSEVGFHAIDLDTNTVFDLYLCPKVRVCPSFLVNISLLLIDWSGGQSVTNSHSFDWFDAQPITHRDQSTSSNVIGGGVSQSPSNLGLLFRFFF